MRTRVPKIVGSDVELSNFIVGVSARDGSGRAASRMLLAEIDGISSGSHYSAQAIDWGRKYLPSTGGCAYIDSDHLECATPETFSAFDHVAYNRAMLSVARDAMHRVNERLPEGCRLHVLANCSDGLGNSYGSHLNVLLSRRAWDDIVLQKPHYLAFLSAFQISSIVFTGQGKVGSERTRPDANFQLSQRADFMETLCSIDTMVFRGVVNSRDEPLCGPYESATEEALARLHVIFYDNTLCQVATLLRVGTLQMIVAMLEAGVVDPRLALESPLEALGLWSRDPSLTTRAPLVDGGERSAVELQRQFLDAAGRFAARGGFEGIVPESDRLIALWADTLARLETRDFDTLSRRLDWVAKYRLLEGVIDHRPSLTWQSREIKQLDQLYASIDDTDGLFWTLERDGLVDTVVSADAIARARLEPPTDTRAWTRTHLLRLAGSSRVAHVDWDRVRVHPASSRAWFTPAREVHLPRPHEDTRAENLAHFVDGADLDCVLEALGATEAAPLTTLGPDTTPPHLIVHPTGGTYEHARKTSIYPGTGARDPWRHQ